MSPALRKNQNITITLLQIFFFFLVLLAYPLNAFSQVWPGPQAQWALDETSGTVLDGSGNGIHAINAGATQGQPGRFNNAYFFNGTSAYVDLGTNTALNLSANGSVTFSAWVKTTESYGPILSFRNNVDLGAQVELTVGFNGVTTSAGTLMALVRENQGSSSYAQVVGNLINNGQWHHVALTRNGTGRIQLFLDGVLQGTQTSTGADGAITTNLRGLGVERSWVQTGFGTADQRFLAGSIDEVRIYKRLLSSTEIQQLANPTDPTPPTVSISSPTSGSTVSGASVTVSANASDNVGVAGVRFKLDGNNLASEDTTSPYSIVWNSTTATNGNHSLTAVARDIAGNPATSTAITVNVFNDKTSPTVSITAPANNATVSGTNVTVSANASDNVGVIGVQFKLDGNNLGAEDTTSPYSIVWNSTTAANGNHSLTAVARDAAGNSKTSSARTVNVSNDTTPPTVSITAPANNATVSGASVLVSANASDNVGVTGVQFKLDGNNLSTEDITSPYSIIWDTNSSLNGNHLLIAVARDVAGNSTTSTAISLTVSNTPVPAAPVLNTAIPGNTQVVLSWNSSATATGYKIKYGTAAGTYSTTIDVGNLTSYTVNNLSNGTSYYFVVSAYNISGDSVNSNEQNAQPLTTGPTNVSGPISLNTVWTLQGSPYIVVGNVTINSGVSLTIQPGVVIKFNGHYTLTVNGTLDAQGFSSAPILFTSNLANPSAGNWDGIIFSAGSGGSTLKYVYVQYSFDGLTFDGAAPVADHVISENNSSNGVWLKGGANGIITNSIFRNNANGVFLSQASAQISGSVISNNGTCVFSNFGSTITLTNNQITNCNYGIQIYEDGSETVNSVINNNSIYGNNIYNLYTRNFGGNRPVNAENNWWGTKSGGLIAEKIYDISDTAAGVGLDVDFIPFLDAPDGNPVTGTFVSGTIATNATWTSAASPYTVIAPITINNGATLTIQPGVVVKFDGYYSLTVNGTLNAQGTAASLITFTSNKTNPAPLDWWQIQMNSTSGASALKYVNVKYGTNAISVAGATPVIDNLISENNTDGLDLVNASGIQVLNSTFRNNVTFGIHAENSGAFSIAGSDIYGNANGIDLFNSSPNITGSKIHNNMTNGINLLNGSSAAITNNEIINNGNIGIFARYQGGDAAPLPVINNNKIYGHNFNLQAWVLSLDWSSLIINAENNWWGTADPAAIAQKIYDKADNPLAPAIDYQPFDSGANVLSISNVSVTPQFFNFAASGTTTFNYTLSASGNVTIKIFDYNNNQLVRTLINAQARSAGALTENWDRKDSAGQNLAVGKYYYTIDVADASGHSGKYYPVYVPGTVQLASSSVAPGNFFSGDNAVITYNLVVPALVTIKAGLEVGTPFSPRTLITDQPRDVANNVELWDGRDNDGNIMSNETINYTVRAWNKLLPDNMIVVQPNTLPALTLTSDPYAIYPLYNQSTVLQYLISLTSKVTLVIKDPTGTSVVKTLVNNQQKTAGTYTVIWDGTDDSGHTVGTGGNYQTLLTTADPASGQITGSRVGNITVFK